MKVPVPPPSPRLKTSANDSLGHGMDAALTILLFFGIGFALDRWLGTTPWFMIGMTLLAAVGYFLKFKYRYDLEMDRLEAERRARLERERAS
jgi:Putative F0F1-ATPase subunit Ca2+/Mg2+ transporter